jgi:hypothetical protein
MVKTIVTMKLDVEAVWPILPFLSPHLSGEGKDDRRQCHVA